MMLRQAILGFLIGCGLASAQSPPGGARLRGETEATQTRKRIAEAQQKIVEGKIPDAIDQLQKILDESGNDLVLVKDNHFQPATRLVQLTLAALPAEALKTYRDRLEAPAKKLLDLGTKNRDPKPLLELRERYFVARPTEKALDLLGELHFERGEYAEAERSWRMLFPSPDSHDFIYPQAAGDTAAYRAKAILAAFAAGEKSRAIAEIAEYSKNYPNAKGRLAGQEGTFAEILAKRIPGETFAPLHASLNLPRLPATRPIWKTPIPRDPTDRGIPRPASIPAAKTLAFHPVVCNGFAYIADAARIFAFDLKTGEARIAYDLRVEPEFAGFDAMELALPNLLGAAFTLTLADGKLYVRLGATAMPGGTEKVKRIAASTIVAFEPLRNGILKKLWHLLPPEGATWEGSPALFDGEFYAAFCQMDERGHLNHGIARYSETPKLLWKTLIYENDVNQTAARNRQELITLAGSNVVYNSHSGITVALDRSTGHNSWAFRNAPPQKPGNGVRDLCPPVYASGKVFIAPNDGDRIYSLDAATGRAIWESPPLSVQQLLGVSDGKLIAAIHGPQKGIRGFNLQDGSTQEPHGWQNHDDPFLATYGKGIAAENAILWPTMEKLYRLNVADGSVQSIPKPGPHGNLAFGEGLLIVATPSEVWAYEGIPGAGEVERPRVPSIQKSVASPITTDFDPLKAPAFRLPLKLSSQEQLPLDTNTPGGVAVGSHRIGFENEHRLTAVNPTTGEIEWSLDSLGRNGRTPKSIESSPRFAPHFLATPTGVWVQTSQGERWLIDNGTGKILRREKSAEVLWQAPPLPLPLGKVAFSDGAGSVRCFDSNHRKHWAYEAGGEASLTGVPPQVGMLGQALLVAVHRNYGIEIQKLDPNTGRALWGKPVLLNNDTFNWSHAAADRSTLFVPSSKNLVAIDLALGRELWRAELPLGDSPAKAIRGRHSVFVYSVQQQPEESLARVGFRIAERYVATPKIAYVFAAPATLAEASTSRGIRIAALDPILGQPQGYQEIPAWPGSTLEFQAEKLAVRSPGTVSWWAAKQ